MTDRRRPMRRLGEVLPSVASDLGLDDQLRQARAMSSWERIVEEHVPQAAGASSMLAIRPPSLLVSATSPIVAQELRLRAEELLDAFAGSPGGTRLLELRVSIRPVEAHRGGSGGSGRPAGPDV
jgi:hypothetical protein